MHRREQPSSRDLPRRADPWLERADQALYVLVALLFLVAAVAMAGYAVLTFLRHLGENFPVHLIGFVNNLLLVLIILEVMGTVRSYLATGATSLRPFLYIGTISATRRILAIGASEVVGGESSSTAFQHLMIDLGVNAAVVLALALALWLFGRRQPAEDERAAGLAETGGRFQ